MRTMWSIRCTCNIDAMTKTAAASAAVEKKSTLNFIKIINQFTKHLSNFKTFLFNLEDVKSIMSATKKKWTNKNVLIDIDSKICISYIKKVDSGTERSCINWLYNAFVQYWRIYVYILCWTVNVYWHSMELANDAIDACIYANQQRKKILYNSFYRLIDTHSKWINLWISSTFSQDIFFFFFLINWIFPLSIFNINENGNE